jgi:hypothetical protein
MSYPLGLDEHSEQDLRNELILREARQRQGLCDYCNRKVNTEPVCKFSERHKGNEG